MLSSYIISYFNKLSLAVIPLILKPKGSECTTQQQILPDMKYKSESRQSVTTVPKSYQLHVYKGDRQSGS